MNCKGLRQGMLFALILCVSLLPDHGQANSEFPMRPIRLIVPVSAGGGLDTTTRAIAQKLTQAWGQQVIVDNRSGASGVLAFDIAIKANPDGYTLLMMSADHVINSVPSAKRPYDITRDVTAVSQATALSYLVYMNPSVQITTFKDLVAYGRANPGKLNYGTPGTGSLQHLGWEVLSQMSGAKFNHVPYKGGAPAIVATIAGEVQIGFITLTSARPHLQSGRARPLAVTSRERMRAMPDLPTVAEAGLPGFELNQYYGAVITSRAPPAIVRKLSGGIAAAVKAPDIRQRFEADGWRLVGSTPEEFRAVIRADLEKWTKVIKDIGLVLN
ncbi:MAG: tripartite tricarboxylate transporter substrate binding protein [Burkholderiales bacterium]|nr:tripartite tricarboxylate transporter substrate binding protein [Burkholderiales bacterium]